LFYISISAIFTAISLLPSKIFLPLSTILLTDAGLSDRDSETSTPYKHDF